MKCADKAHLGDHHGLLGSLCVGGDGEGQGGDGGGGDGSLQHKGYTAWRLENCCGRLRVRAEALSKCQALVDAPEGGHKMGVRCWWQRVLGA